ncbi:MAG: type 2 isopentenyl-diphosphate Delta-isomerase [Anaerolineaceae bacterium]|nr:type 2 isopentenyl-diphosphate Delta-isomerase [Anaerolineaceae bacterium]
MTKYEENSNSPIDKSQLASRKSDHIRINLEEDVQSTLQNGFNNYRFIHEALPEINLDEIDLSQNIFNKNVQIPILISSMTGGTPEAEKINLLLAEAAQEYKIALGIGSQRVAIENPELANSFRVRRKAPDILLFANLGAIQLNYGYTIEHCKRAVDMIDADALILHLNALQEALQPEGETNFAGLLAKIEMICKQLPTPVIAKEVGWGISERTARLLANAGVSAIDIAGAGGTSWSQVEMYRSKDKKEAMVARSFHNWGIPTAQSILEVRKGAPQMMIFASGGIGSGIDIAKSIALGSSLGGIAGAFLKTAKNSLADTVNVIELLSSELKISMFSVGAKNVKQLRNSSLIYDVSR